MGMIDFNELSEHMTHYGIRIVSLDVTEPVHNFPVSRAPGQRQITRDFRFKLQYLKKTATTILELGSPVAPKDTLAWYIQATLLQQAVSPIQLDLGNNVYAIPTELTWTLHENLVFDIDVKLRTLESIPLNVPVLDDIKVPEARFPFEPRAAPKKEEKPQICRPKKWI